MVMVLASTLSGKPVLSTNGEELGTVENITMNVDTGALEAVRVAPATDTIRGFDVAENGSLLVPAACLCDVDDYLLVERPDR
ncbi:PRC-barrel domain-containing protein [Natronolimnobius baerhuensis]|uniref:Photosystem reaction center subunit H n=1 Tax=Natronolimnobius baerhuensis TaxID=253108 RepID=A0A202EBM8_9EURY|nr:PRC-barrel domain-containing protein [Natronolimnobius baerhuensis]OVE85649.1 photosystem reaction center subunit H [Natronolimnobius baerhuensis]